MSRGPLQSTPEPLLSAHVAELLPSDPLPESTHTHQSRGQRSVSGQGKASGRNKQNEESRAEQMNLAQALMSGERKNSTAQFSIAMSAESLLQVALLHKSRLLSVKSDQFCICLDGHIFQLCFRRSHLLILAFCACMFNL